MRVLIIALIAAISYAQTDRESIKNRKREAAHESKERPVGVRDPPWATDIRHSDAGCVHVMPGNSKFEISIPQLPQKGTADGRPFPWEWSYAGLDPNWKRAPMNYASVADPWGNREGDYWKHISCPFGGFADQKFKPFLGQIKLVLEKPLASDENRYCRFRFAVEKYCLLLGFRDKGDFSTIDVQKLTEKYPTDAVYWNKLELLGQGRIVGSYDMVELLQPIFFQENGDRMIPRKGNKFELFIAKVEKMETSGVVQSIGIFLDEKANESAPPGEEIETKVSQDSHDDKGGDTKQGYTCYFEFPKDLEALLRSGSEKEIWWLDNMKNNLVCKVNHEWILPINSPDDNEDMNEWAWSEYMQQAALAYTSYLYSFSQLKPEKIAYSLPMLLRIHKNDDGITDQKWKGSFTHVQVERLFEPFTRKCDDLPQLSSFNAFVQHKFNYNVQDQQGCWSVTSQTAGSNTLYMTDGQFNRKQKISGKSQDEQLHDAIVHNFIPKVQACTNQCETAVTVQNSSGDLNLGLWALVFFSLVLCFCLGNSWFDEGSQLKISLIKDSDHRPDHMTPLASDSFYNDDFDEIAFGSKCHRVSVLTHPPRPQ